MFKLSFIKHNIYLYLFLSQSYLIFLLNRLLEFFGRWTFSRSNLFLIFQDLLLKYFKIALDVSLRILKHVNLCFLWEQLWKFSKENVLIALNSRWWLQLCKTPGFSQWWMYESIYRSFIIFLLKNKYLRKIKIVTSLYKVK